MSNQKGIKKLDIQTSVITKLLDKSNNRIAKALLDIANEYCFKIKNYEKATEYYERALDLKPNYIEALNGLAQHQRLKIKNFNYAIELYTKAIEINPKYEYLYFRRGICKVSLNDYKGAIEDYLADIKVKSEINSSDYVSVALIRLKIDDFYGAIEDCTKAIDMNDKNDFAFYIRGEAKFHLKNFTEAINDFKNTVEIEKEKMKITNVFKRFSLGNLKYYGKAKFEIQEYDAALKIFNKCLEQYPKHHFTYELIAECYGKLNNYEKYKINVEKFNSLNEVYLKKMEKYLALEKQKKE